MVRPLPAVVLAGGASTRMGRPKGALPLGPGQTVLSRGVATLVAAGLAPVVVVTGAVPDLLDRAGVAVGPVIRQAPNAAWGEGQLSSLIAGLAAVDDGRIEAVVVTLVDVPLVRVETVDAVVDAWARTRAPIVRPADGDRHGHPVVFDRAVFDALRAADRSVGAKAVFAAHRDAIVNVPVDDPWAFEDLDTPDDYARMLARVGG